MQLQTLTMDSTDAITRLRSISEANRHRGALILTGTKRWCLEAFSDIHGCNAVDRDLLWIGTHAVPGVVAVPAAQAGRVLGQEYGTVVFDGWSGFNVDALGAVSGTIRGGGQLFLLMPPLGQWTTYADPARARFVAFGQSTADIDSRWFGHLQRCVGESIAVLVLDQDGGVSGTLPSLRVLCPMTGDAIDDPDCLTLDQARAVAAVIRAGEGQRRKPAILVSDRGRGKSAALGIAAARLMRQGRKRIVVTGPRRDTVSTLFDHAARLLPKVKRSRSALQLGESRIEYLAPDKITERISGDAMIMVDEAAAIPLPLLMRMMRDCSRLALATTVHGYEGTGRGFDLRFGQLLSAHSRGLRRVTLTTPVRWAIDDPVERFIFSALMLDAGTEDPADMSAAAATEYEIERIDRDALATDRALLDQVFGLLVSSHYRTRPSDLRYLLDAPGVSVYIGRCRSAIAAAALVVAEGGFSAALARDVVSGRRRPRGHLVPVSLGSHLGLGDAPGLRYGRVVRIAVRPELRRCGLGSRLIECIVQTLRQEGVDCLGVSYGADPDLLSFWTKTTFLPARLGVTRGTTSGANALLMLRGLSTAGDRLTDQTNRLFNRRLPDQLADPLRKADPRLVLCLLHERPSVASPNSDDLATAAAFAAGQCSYEDSAAELVPVAWHLLKSTPVVASDKAGHVCLVLKVLQKRPWTECARVLGLAGRKDVLELLQGTIHAYCETVQGLSSMR